MFSGSVSFHSEPERSKLHDSSEQFAQIYLHSCVDSSVCAQTEVGARDVVADGSWDDTHGDAELIVVTAGLVQLQNSFISLSKRQTDDLNSHSSTSPAQWFWREWTYLKSSNNEQSGDAVFGDVIYDLLNVCCRTGSEERHEYGYGVLFQISVLQLLKSIDYRCWS